MCSIYRPHGRVRRARRTELYSEHFPPKPSPAPQTSRLRASLHLFHRTGSPCPGPAVPVRAGTTRPGEPARPAESPARSPRFQHRGQRRRRHRPGRLTAAPRPPLRAARGGGAERQGARLPPGSFTSWAKVTALWPRLFASFCCSWRAPRGRCQPAAGGGTR